MYREVQSLFVRGAIGIAVALDVPGEEADLIGVGVSCQRDGDGKTR